MAGHGHILFSWASAVEIKFLFKLGVLNLVLLPFPGSNHALEDLWPPEMAEITSVKNSSF